jgi:sugar lactone lactonase YvrE
MAAWSEAKVLFESAQRDLRFLPEGPFHLGEGRFSWVAIQHGAAARVGSLNIFDLNSGTNRNYPLPGRPGFARPTNDPAKFIVGAERELAIYDIHTDTWDVFCRGVDQDVDNTIINDATTYGDNIIFGTKDLEFKTKKAGLYLFRGADRKLIRLRDDQICSNGKAVVETPDGQLFLYDIDTPTRKIVRYQLDVAAGKLSGETTAIDFSAATGFPDGMTLTADGQSAIVSFYNPDEAEYGLTQQYNLATGQLEHDWRTPLSPQNTCPLLLPSKDGSVKLVITTAVEHMPQERQQRSHQAGCLFIADTQLREAPATTPFKVSMLLR